MVKHIMEPPHPFVSGGAAKEEGGGESCRSRKRMI